MGVALGMPGATGERKVRRPMGRSQIVPRGNRLGWTSRSATVSQLFPSGNRMTAIALTLASGIAAMEAIASSLADSTAPASIALRTSGSRPCGVRPAPP